MTIWGRLMLIGLAALPFIPGELLLISPRVWKHVR